MQTWPHPPISADREVTEDAKVRSAVLGLQAAQCCSHGCLLSMSTELGIAVSGM